MSESVPEMPAGFDQDAVDAALNLFHRAGAKEVEFGYTDPEKLKPGEAVTWYAWMALHDGEKIMVSDKPGPVEALETLARRIINGARCTYCLHVMSLSGKPRAGICRWTRQGDQWVRGCVETDPEKQLHIKPHELPGVLNG